MKKYRLQAIVMILVAFMLGCNEFIVVGILSDIANQFDISIATVGYLVTIFATVYAISTPIITIYTSRFSRYKTLLTLMLIFLIGNTLSGFAINYVMLVISRIITAMVAGVIISLIMTFASTIAPREKRASLVAWIFAGFSIASVFGVPIGTAISTNYNWRYAFFIISVISIITFYLLAKLLPKDNEQTQSSIREQLVLLRDRRIYLCIGLVFFTAATMYAYYTYIRPLLTNALGFSVDNLNWLLFLIGIMSIIGNRLSGELAAHSGLLKTPRFYIFDIILLSSMSLALSSKIWGLLVLLILTLIVTIANAPTQVHFLNVAESDYPQALLLASSLNSIFFNFGISLGSATSSVLVGVVGLQNIGIGAALYAVISLVISLLLIGAIKQHK